MTNTYLENANRFHWGPGLARLNPEKTKLLDRFAVGSVLDIGCGSGIYADYLFSKGHTVTGLDTQAEFLVQNRHAFPAIPFIQGSVEALPFKKKQFETAILFDILEHVDDHRAMEQVKQVASRVIISVPHTVQPILRKYSLVHHHYLDQTHSRTYTPKELERLLKKHGFKVLHLAPALPISLSGLLIHQLAQNSNIKKWMLKLLLKPFLPEPPLYSTVIAVGEQ